MPKKPKPAPDSAAPATTSCEHCGEEIPVAEVQACEACGRDGLGNCCIGTVDHGCEGEGE